MTMLFGGFLSAFQCLQFAESWPIFGVLLSGLRLQALNREPESALRGLPDWCWLGKIPDAAKPTILSGLYRAAAGRPAQSGNPTHQIRIFESGNQPDKADAPVLRRPRDSWAFAPQAGPVPPAPADKHWNKPAEAGAAYTGRTYTGQSFHPVHRQPRQ